MPHQQSLFGSQGNKQSAEDKTAEIMTEPLAERVRPQTLDQYVGHANLLGKNGILRKIIKSHGSISFILWGPAGEGKTTLAHIIANATNAKFISLSATNASVSKLKKVMKHAELDRAMGKRTIVFMDEIHRFNKAQQDAFLPYVEKGSITLIGATTENPSFNLNSALLSRCKVFVFHKLTVNDIKAILKNALKNPLGLKKNHVQITKQQLTKIARFADGDARQALNILAIAVDNGQHVKGHTKLSDSMLKQLMGRKFYLYDKNGDEHYDLISALHKSVRNSDVNSSIYWLYRMLDGGEDPLYIARRLIRMSSEDVGLADPSCLNMCVSAMLACKLLGMPECRLALVQATVRLAVDPKSNALYKAGLMAQADIKKTKNLSVPLQIRNAPTKLMKNLGYHEHYKYAHNYKHHTTSMNTMPEDLRGHQYYYPTNEGLESHFKNRINYLKQIKLYKKKHHDDGKIGNFKPMDLNQFM